MQEPERIMGSRRAGNGPVFGVLLGASLLASLALVPYELTLLPAAAAKVPLPVLIVAVTIQSLVLAAVAIAVGLWLGDKVGLGAPLLRDWLAGDPAAPRTLRAQLPRTVALGLATGVVITAAAVLTKPLLPPLSQAATAPAIWQGFLAAFYGGIQEEILLRLGVMTFLVWLGSRITRQTTPGAGVVWTAIVVSALLFGAGHLPAAYTLYGATLPVTAWIVLNNAIGGLVFGWVYWRQGLLSAMVAHFSADLVLHVLAPSVAMLVGLR